MLQAKIYAPCKSVMQSGRAQSDQWILEYRARATRTPETLMGWTQSDKTLNQVTLTFSDLDSAKAYAEKIGVSYFVAQQQNRDVKPRNYGDNFKNPIIIEQERTVKQQPKTKAKAKTSSKKANKKSTPVAKDKK